MTHYTVDGRNPKQPLGITPKGHDTGSTVDGRNPKQPPGMYENPVNTGITDKLTIHWLAGFLHHLQHQQCLDVKKVE